MNTPEMTTAPGDLDVRASSGGRCNPANRNQKGNTIMARPKHRVIVNPAVETDAFIEDWDDQVGLVIGWLTAQKPPWEEAGPVTTTVTPCANLRAEELHGLIDDAHAYIGREQWLLPSSWSEQAQGWTSIRPRPQRWTTRVYIPVDREVDSLLQRIESATPLDEVSGR